MLPVRINANGKALTVKELLEQKKNMHVNTFRYMLDELGRELRLMEQKDRANKQKAQEEVEADSDADSDDELEYLESEESMQQFLDQLVDKCAAVLKKHELIDAVKYTNDATHRELVSEMLDTKSAAISSLRLTLEDPTAGVTYVAALNLWDGKRQYLGFLERNLPADEGKERVRKARQLCTAMGIMRSKVDEKDEDGMTRLMRAAADGEGIKCLRMLVEARADLAAQDNFGRTPLCHAAEGGHPEAVRALVEMGADVNFVTGDDESPMTIASFQGHAHVVRILVELDAGVDTKNGEGESSLVIATRLGFVEVVSALVELKADINLKSKKGHTPLYLAENERKWNEKSDKIAEILRSNAEEDESGDANADEDGNDEDD